MALGAQGCTVFAAYSMNGGQNGNLARQQETVS